ncbi:hypothetical protein [Nocardioides sp.]|uniref:hypothetical protein n=1 Tax=Nocardioides sp. TaxID=35761 RepID=UPI002734D59D|nr:hypothetical protein [Nocardioides sp.]MDP3891570.1 hypothetical protein [Nocardioides sp.]
MASSRNPLQAPVLLGCAALLGYAGLKIHWALGGAAGIADPPAWRESIDRLGQAEQLAAFWGTVAIDALGAVVLVALAGTAGTRGGRGLLRRLLRGGSLVAAVVLGLAAIGGTLVTLGPVLGLWEGREDAFGPIAPGTFLFVYGCFGVYAGALARIHHLTRPAGR